MALLDICGVSTERSFILELPTGTIGTVLTDIVASRFDKGLRSQVIHIPGWPVAGDVKTGVVYGPTWVEYVGTYSGGGGGGASRVIGSPIVRRIVK